jgi:hypothetical protein
LVDPMPSSSSYTSQPVFSVCSSTFSRCTEHAWNIASVDYFFKVYGYFWHCCWSSISGSQILPPCSTSFTDHIYSYSLSWRADYNQNKWL